MITKIPKNKLTPSKAFNIQQRDLSLIKDEINDARSQMKDLGNKQYTRPAITASVPNIVMGLFLQLGFTQSIPQIVSIFSIVVAVALVQEEVYRSKKKDQNIRLTLALKAEESILKGEVLNSNFREEIDTEVKKKSSVFSKISPSLLFKIAVGASSSIALFGSDINQTKKQESPAITNNREEKQSYKLGK